MHNHNYNLNTEKKRGHRTFSDQKLKQGGVVDCTTLQYCWKKQQVGQFKDIYKTTIKKFGHPKKFNVITLKFEQGGFTVE